jgi:hypothetical protein
VSIYLTDGNGMNKKKETEKKAKNCNTRGFFRQWHAAKLDKKWKEKKKKL